MTSTSFADAQENIERVLAISTPAQLRKFFKDYPPKVLPDLFTRLNKTEIAHFCEVCELPGEELYRTLAWLPRNVHAELAQLKSKGLDLEAGVKESGLPQRRTLLLTLRAVCVYRERKNQAKGRILMNRQLARLERRYVRDKNAAQAILKDVRNKPAWGDLHKELRKYLIVNRHAHAERTRKLRAAKSSIRSPHHNTYMPGDVYLVAQEVVRLFEKKGENEAQSATRRLFAQAGIELKKTRFANWLCKKQKDRR